MEMFEMTVKDASDAATEIRRITLAAPDGRELPPFTPGAHIDVVTPSGHVRQYSLCNSASSRLEYVIAVKREPQSRGGSASMHDSVRAGTSLRIGAPRNNFELSAAEPEVVLLAGGIGVTPLFCMAEQLLRQGRKFCLHYFARSRDHLAFAEVFDSPKWAPHARLHLGLDANQTATALKLAIGQASAKAGVYICGPLPFMDTALEQAHVLPAGQVHSEYFAAPAQPDHTGDQPFDVLLRRSGTRLHVPAGKSILAVMSEHGIYADFSCEQGVCGTCAANVVAGTPDHRDFYLTDEEKAECRQMMICVSRAKGDVIELDF